MGREGLHQPEGYLDLSGIVCLQQLLHHLIATLAAGGPGDAWLHSPQHSTSALFSYHLRVHGTFWGRKARGVGGREKDRCTDFSTVPFICFYRAWGGKKVSARTWESPCMKGKRKGKNILSLPGREQVYCIWQRKTVRRLIVSNLAFTFIKRFPNEGTD